MLSNRLRRLVKPYSHYLLLNNWQGLWMDGNEQHVQSIRSKFDVCVKGGQLTVKSAFLTSANIDELISETVSCEVDMLSVDVDGNDFHNAKKDPSLDWVMTYNPDCV